MKRPPSGSVQVACGGEVLAQRLDHRVAPPAVDLDQVGDVLAPAPFGEVLADEVLGQGRAAEVGGLLAEHDLLHHRRRRHRPAEADAGGEDLGEGADVDDEVAAVELVERGQGLAAEAQQAVRVVLDDEQLALPRQLDQPPPPLERHRHPGGVLEARHRVDEFGSPPFARRAARAPLPAPRSASRPRRSRSGSSRPGSCRRPAPRRGRSAPRR